MLYIISLHSGMVIGSHRPWEYISLWSDNEYALPRAAFANPLVISVRSATSSSDILSVFESPKDRSTVFVKFLSYNVTCRRTHPQSIFDNSNRGMTNYRNGPQWRQIGGTTDCNRDGVSCQEPQRRQTEVQETVMKCKENRVSWKKWH